MGAWNDTLWTEVFKFINPNIKSQEVNLMKLIQLLKTKQKEEKSF